MSRASILQLGRFLGVGALNTVVGLLVIYAAMGLLHLGEVAANAVGYSVGVALSFALNGRWTFGYRGAQVAALSRFMLVTLLAYGLNLLTVMSVLRGLGWNAYLAQALGVPVFTLTSYLGCKYYVFRPEPVAQVQHDG